MAITTDSQAHLPALGTHERGEIGNELQATLLELVDLSLLGKQLHWSVVGPLFRPLHLYLDELIERKLADGSWKAVYTSSYGTYPGLSDEWILITTRP